MPFNDKKCHVIAFGDQTYRPDYRLGNVQMEWTESTKYLGVIMQSNLRFDQHISLKKEKASKILGAIKHILHEAPKHGRLLAYTSLCRPILEYADSMWDPSRQKDIDSLEMIQNRAARFISRIRGRESITEAKAELGLQLLQDRRRNHRLALLMKILEDEDRHSALASAYDEIIESRKGGAMTTRAAARGELASVYATTHTYYNSFLPRSIRDLRGNHQPGTAQESAAC